MNALIGMLIDRSGSMRYSEAITVAGINKFIEYQQLRQDDAVMHLATFNSSTFTVLRDFVPMYEMPMVQSHEYKCGGGTPLYDSIDRMITDMQSHIDSLPEDERPLSVTLVIQADGDDDGPSNFYPSAMYRKSEMDAWLIGKGAFPNPVPYNELASIPANELTEGFEMRSQFGSRVSQMMVDKVNEGWEFVYMACNVDPNGLNLPFVERVGYESSTSVEGFEGVAKSMLEASVTGKLSRVVAVKAEV